MKLVLGTLLLLTTLSAKNIINIYTDDIIGKVTIERSDIVILNSGSKWNYLLKTLHITIITCNTEECRLKTIYKYKNIYKTNTIGVLNVY